jgi:hypothetical protein
MNVNTRVCVKARIKHETYQTVIVIAVPADGAMTLAKMLYFLPSIASVRVRPMIADFAVEYFERLSASGPLYSVN